MRQESLIKSRSFDFPVRIVKLYRVLTGTRKEFVRSKQLLRFGTSVGANAVEALSAFTQKDYAAKFSIARKKMPEAIYWLELLQRTDFLTEKEFNSINSDAVELMEMDFGNRNYDAKTTWEN